ncbi:PspC domain-containing protein [Pseudonocardia sp. H11422]|uniref:PspC domain-containing protein n=1 Tax=Pseudonocardia sp. H11422 TaxID=2835866 RepID=UPI001BDC81D9|nr:PspC domain-containing protein [Pseudonocardia sp. H11422]
MEPTTEHTARPATPGDAPGATAAGIPTAPPGGAAFTTDPWAGFAPGPAALPPAAGPTRERFTLRRSRTDRMLGGVCGGLATSLGVDAALLRIGLVVLTVLGFGAGAVIYLAAWILAPEEEPAV